MDHRFSCTACGKCCFGWLPLTIADALAHAGRFPLAMVWTPYGPNPSFALTGRLGIRLDLPGGRKVAVRIAPTAYIPPKMRCPELTADGRCAIHPIKPLRCRTMPLLPFREESDQAEMLKPRPGWDCDTGPDATLVYRNGRAVERADFDAERAELLRQAPQLRAYAEGLLAQAPRLRDILAQAAGQAGANVVMGISGLLRALPGIDAAEVARRQLPVLESFLSRTEGEAELASYAGYYRDWINELTPIARSI